MKKNINVVTIALSLIAIIISVYVLLIVSENKIIISFNANYDNQVNDIEVIRGESINLPILKRDGYIFLGWYINDTMINDSYHFRKPIKVNAKWIKEVERKTYSVTFDTKEMGSYARTQIVKYGERIKKPDVEINYSEGNFATCGKCGKCPDHIKEWQLDGQIYDFDSPITNDIKLDAVWEYIYNKCKS